MSTSSDTFGDGRRARMRVPRPPWTTVGCMTPEQLLSRCRGLWHVAPSGAWAQIQRHGLRTAQQLIEASDLPEPERSELASTPRPANVPLTVDGETVVLRDQQALTRRKDLDDLLGKDMTVADWIALLNRRSYLFADQAAKTRFVDKHVAASGAQEVLIFSPRRLVELHGSRLELADQAANALGRTATSYRFRDTFMPVARFPDRLPKEVTIPDGLSADEVAAVVMRAERVTPEGVTPLFP